MLATKISAGFVALVVGVLALGVYAINMVNFVGEAIAADGLHYDTERWLGVDDDENLF